METSVTTESSLSEPLNQDCVTDTIVSARLTLRIMHPLDCRKKYCAIEFLTGVLWNNGAIVFACHAHLPKAQVRLAHLWVYRWEQIHLVMDGL